MSSPQKVHDDVWKDSDIARKYALIESASRPYAEILVEKSNLLSLASSPSPSLHILDLGCGTGIVSAVIHETIPPSHWPALKILGADISEPMLSYLEQRSATQGWKALTTQVVDASNIDLEPNQFTHVLGNAILLFLPPSSVAALHALLRPGGFLGVTTWAKFTWYALLQRAVANLEDPPEIPSPEEAHLLFQRGHAWHDPAFLKGRLEEAGFEGVQVVQERRKVPFGTPNEMMSSVGMALQMVGSRWEEEKREEIMERVRVELRKVMVEETGGEEEVLWMDMMGNVGYGWKK